jgi:hypothetical protein
MQEDSKKTYYSSGAFVTFEFLKNSKYVHHILILKYLTTSTGIGGKNTFHSQNRNGGRNRKN